jgi:hypothetical protein
MLPAAPRLNLAAFPGLHFQGERDSLGADPDSLKAALIWRFSPGWWAARR